eukprot:m.148614 g.148614  ORF g.148614 m.148614 type:complete len:363 (+) comp11667_c1_seq9:540-1628(+)
MTLTQHSIDVGPHGNVCAAHIEPLVQYVSRLRKYVSVVAKTHLLDTLNANYVDPAVDHQNDGLEAMGVSLDGINLLSYLMKVHTMTKHGQLEKATPYEGDLKVAYDKVCATFTAAGHDDAAIPKLETFFTTDDGAPLDGLITPPATIATTFMNRSLKDLASNIHNHADDHLKTALDAWVYNRCLLELTTREVEEARIVTTEHVHSKRWRGRRRRRYRRRQRYRHRRRPHPSKHGFGLKKAVRKLVRKVTGSNNLPQQSRGADIQAEYRRFKAWQVELNNKSKAKHTGKRLTFMHALRRQIDSLAANPQRFTRTYLARALLVCLMFWVGCSVQNSHCRGLTHVFVCVCVYFQPVVLYCLLAQS